MNINPEQMHAAASHIERNYGHAGYSVEKIETPAWLVSVFHVVAGDGSRFMVAADRYGNTRDVDPARGFRDLVQEMAEAVTA